jgi:TPP-dependent pyruvate/acetoin dehydrogenase alpha subunit
MTPEFKKKLYYNMLRIRLIEEAIAVGVCANLRKEDYVMSPHRAHGHYLAKGGNLKAMISEICGKATGCSKGKGGSQHSTDWRYLLSDAVNK